jgi:site-specific recombinase
MKNRIISKLAQVAFIIVLFFENSVDAGNHRNRNRKVAAATIVGAATGGTIAAATASIGGATAGRVLGGLALGGLGGLALGLILTKKGDIKKSHRKYSSGVTYVKRK